MKIAFDVDVLAKQYGITDMVRKVADWGFKYIEQSPHPRINPFYKHPLFSRECEEEYRKALKETGVEISSFICFSFRCPAKTILCGDISSLHFFAAIWTDHIIYLRISV